MFPPLQRMPLLAATEYLIVHPGDSVFDAARSRAA
jgi:hypothetical protein